MEVKATAKYIRVQPRKVRIIADQLRGQTAEKSAALLRYHTSKSATLLRKVLVSAMANAEENQRIAPENLRIAAITVDEGPRLKRMRARAMGRGNRITKKTSHITVVVEDFEPEGKIRPHGTKPKPRRTLGQAPKKKGSAAKPTPEPIVAEPVVVDVAPEVVEAPIIESVPVEPEAVQDPAVTEVEASTPVEETAQSEPVQDEPAQDEPAPEETAQLEETVENPEEDGQN